MFVNEFQDQELALEDRLLRKLQVAMWKSKFEFHMGLLEKFTHHILTQPVGENNKITHDVIEMCAPAAPPIMLRIGTRSLNHNPKP